MTDIVTHITVNGDKKLREMTDAAYQRGLRDGYTSRVKDELAARWHGSRVTSWTCSLTDNNQIELTLSGNRLDYDDADQIAATLIDKLNAIRAREAHERNANDKEEEQND